MFKRYFPTAAACAAAAVLSTGCGPVEEPQTDSLGNVSDGLSSAQFWHDLRAYSGTSMQCNSGVNISEGVYLGNWTSRMRIDTDSRAGGCYQKFSVLDPAGELTGLNLSVDFHGQANLTGYGQCDIPGIYGIPVGSSVSWSSVYGIDTNEDPGGCVQAFSLSGRGDVAFDVKYEDDGYNGQCDKVGTHTVTSSTGAKSIVFDMDDRGGGCFVSYRLRKIQCGDSICDPNEYCAADCKVCGDNQCNYDETKASCAADCVPCGDGVCESEYGESPSSCSLDCGTCGNGRCDPNDRFECPEECSTGCGMRICPEDPI